MYKSPLPTITHVPVLIQSSEKASLDGVGTLFLKGTDEFSGLHVVSKQEALSGDGWKHLTGEQRQLAGGVALLQRAMRERSWQSFQDALDLVEKYVPHDRSGEIEFIRNSKSWKQAGLAYSGLMSNLLQAARFIIWYSPKENRFLPGLVCPDWKVAVYAVIGMGQQRVCKKPGCGKHFIPGPKKHEYCCEKHRNADAQRRWKEAHPKRAKEQARLAREKARKALNFCANLC